MTMDNYLNSIEKRLHIGRNTRTRVLESIRTELALLTEKGESPEAAQKLLGSPEKIAEEYNETFKTMPEYRYERLSYYLVRITAVLGILALLFFAVPRIAAHLFLMNQDVSPIDGVTGPDYVVVTMSPTGTLPMLILLQRLSWILLVLFLLSVAALFICKYVKGGRK